MSLWVDVVPLGTTWRTVMARLDRDSAQRRAVMARKVARPGEPHAKARTRVIAAEQDVQRRMERAVFFGDES